MQDYVVGQVLFLTSNSSLKIIPAQIIEEVIRTTIKGKEKTYMIQFPDDVKTTKDIKNIKGNIFTTQKEIRNFMIKNATTAIDKMITNALKIRDNSFSNIHNNEILENNNFNISNDVITDVEDNNEIMQQSVNEDIINVDLGNGTLGRMNVNSLKKVGLN